jgi:SAM-dependent methyltransferase
MDVYGADFAWVYNEVWHNFSERLWPFISKVVKERVPDARERLDLCCGSGHLLKILVREGYTATGLDLSTHMLKHAKRNAPAARLVHGDIRDFDLRQQFDVITCLFDSVNYLTRRHDLERAFRNARRHLRESGLFLFDVDTLGAYANMQYAPSVRRSEDLVTLEEGWFDSKRACRHTLITGFIKRGKLYRRFEEDHVQRGYERDEVSALLKRAGFSLQCYDARTLGKPRPGSKRLVYACKLK